MIKHTYLISLYLKFLTKLYLFFWKNNKTDPNPYLSSIIEQDYIHLAIAHRHNPHINPQVHAIRCYSIANLRSIVTVDTIHCCSTAVHVVHHRSVVVNYESGIGTFCFVTLLDGYIPVVLLYLFSFLLFQFFFFMFVFLIFFIMLGLWKFWMRMVDGVVSVVIWSIVAWVLDLA